MVIYLCYCYVIRLDPIKVKFNFLQFKNQIKSNFEPKLLWIINGQSVL